MFEDSSAPALARKILDRLWWSIPLLATALAYHMVYEFDLIGDARFLILENRNITSLELWYENLTSDYFWSSSTNYIPYWRPLTKLSWLLEYQLFGGWCGGYHLVQLFWHLLAVAGVLALGCQYKLDRRMTALAGLFFGLHPVAIEPVCLVMARSDVVCLSLVVWSAWAWQRWVIRGQRRWLLVCALLLVGALASKETAVVMAPVFSVWLWLRRDLRRWPALLPAWSLTLAYLVARTIILDHGNTPAPTLDPLRWIASMSLYLQNLLPLRIDSSVRSLAATEAASTGFVLYAVITAVVVIALVVLLRHDRQRPEWQHLVWICLSLVPVLVVEQIHVPGVEGKYPLADRWLYHALPAASLLWVGLLSRLTARVEGKLLPVAAGSAAALWVAFSLIAAGSARASYANEQTYLDHEDDTYLRTPEAHRTREDRCRHLDRQTIRALLANNTARVITRSQLAIKRCGATFTRQFNLFSSFVRSGQYRRARPLLDALLAQEAPDHRNDASLAYLGGVVRLHHGAPEAAATLFRRAERLGLQSCKLELYAAQAEHGRGRHVAAARRLERAFVCGGRRNLAFLLQGAMEWIHAGKPAEARRLVARIRAFEGPGARLTPAMQLQLGKLSRQLSGLPR